MMNGRQLLFYCLGGTTGVASVAASASKSLLWQYGAKKGRLATLPGAAAVARWSSSTLQQQRRRCLQQDSTSSQSQQQQQHNAVNNNRTATVATTIEPPIKRWQKLDSVAGWQIISSRHRRWLTTKRIRNEDEEKETSLMKDCNDNVWQEKEEDDATVSTQHSQTTVHSFRGGRLGTRSGEEDEKRTSITSSTATRSSRGNLLTRELRRGAGAIVAASGFVASTVQNLWAAKNHRHRDGLDDDDLVKRPLQTMADSLKLFLKDTGIDLELSRSLNGRLVENLILLRRLQRHLLQDKDVRDLVATKGVSTQHSSAEALRYMRYATAAYGDAMIRAVQLEATGEYEMEMFGNETLTKTRVSRHVGVPAEDLGRMDVDYSGDVHHLRHFVAVDHKNSKVILAIRGTFTLSELIVDAVGFSRPFCGGEAHSEMANMAEKVWEVAGPTVVDLLEQNNGYDLVLTGHSLGAGTACLLNILLHDRHHCAVHNYADLDHVHLSDKAKPRKIECFAYASPPVFAPLSAAPRAVGSCTNYVHANDMVPFLSVDSIRHIFGVLNTCSEQAQRLGWRARVAMATGGQSLNDDAPLVREVRRALAQRPTRIKGAPRLAIPAATNAWIFESPVGSGRYQAKDCDSNRLATLGIQIDPNMLQDHFPSRYEHALHNLDD